MRRGPNGAGLSRKSIFAEIDASLRRLGTDYVDLYQIHRFDRTVPLEETLEALHDVVKSGKARYIGASSMYAWQFTKALYTQRLHGWTQVRVDAEPLQPPLPRGGARDAAGVRGSGHRGDPVEPARPRPSHPRLGRRRPRGPRPTSSGPLCTSRRTRRSSNASPRWPRIAAFRGRRWHWRGCCAIPVVTAPIIGVTKPAPPRGRRGSVGLRVDRRRGAAHRGTLRAAPHRRTFVSVFRRHGDGKHSRPNPAWRPR